MAKQTPGIDLMASESRPAMQNGDKALIIGAGPAGLTAALALGRVGIPAAVFERAPALIMAGAGLGVQSNALRALQKLGVGDTIEAAGTELRNQETLDSRGKLLFTMPKGEVADEFGTPTISVARSDVQLAVMNVLAEGIVRSGRECVAVEQDPEGVTATFADGSTERGALLIAADGGRSVVRTHVYGEADPTPRYSGFTIWRSIVEMPPDELPPHTSRTFLGYGQQFAMFPIGRNRIYWGLMQLEPEGQRDSRPGLRDKLIDELAGFPEVTRRLVLATDEAAIQRTDIHDRDPEQTWHKGRVVLIGDAAHMTTPFLGQGAGIAMEDSVVLAKELSLTDGLRDQRMLASALRSFEGARMKRTKSVVLSARRWGQLYSYATPTVVSARNAILHAIPSFAWKKIAAASIVYDV
jgi:2-polyprenyl-6-methoxyphenol hydroxylase-like FAD-dependent oxidoreductase